LYSKTPRLKGYPDIPALPQSWGGDGLGGDHVFFVKRAEQDNPDDNKNRTGGLPHGHDFAED